jgi:hypothetical protein
MTELEKRALTEPVEYRDENGSRKLVGYAAVFNSEAVIGDSFREKIMPGAFAETIKNNDIRALFNHNKSALLGRTKSGTLRLTEDERGLRYEVDLPDTQTGRDLIVSMDRGDIDGSSFGFNVPRGGDEWDFSRDLPLRTIRQANVAEVSVVVFPAYDDATASLRCLDGARQERAEHNRQRAEARIAERKAASEQKFRRLG